MSRTRARLDALDIVVKPLTVRLGLVLEISSLESGGLNFTVHSPDTTAAMFPRRECLSLRSRLNRQHLQPWRFVQYSVSNAPPHWERIIVQQQFNRGKVERSHRSYTENCADRAGQAHPDRTHHRGTGTRREVVTHMGR